MTLGRLGGALVLVLSFALVGVAAVSVDADTQRVRVGGAVRPPRAIKHVAAVYPEDAKADGVSGIVILNIVIGTNGSVIEASVIRSIPRLDQAALDAVRQWEYEPATLNGEPVEVEMTVTVNFALD